ncbi:MAG: hypothetical protein M3R36_02685 [Bacteroidota bacterium]|nr:hypothetical protein [Bacteroidota bacterium]
MSYIIRVFLPLIAIIVFVNLYFAHPEGIHTIGGYPIWMKDSKGNHTDQTSGIFFAGLSDGKKVFVCADDIGKIRRLTIDERIDPPHLTITNINFSDEVKTLFQKFKKVDMEEIVFDSTNNRILLVIEGHEYSSRDPEIYKKKEGVYEITFNKDILTFDTLKTIKRLTLPEQIYSYTHDNIGFEGFAATKDYFFLGLENYRKTEYGFTDSTMLYIVNKNTNQLKIIGTSDLKITTICGLYAVDDYNLYGIDRNRKSMFYIKFNPDFTVNKCEIKEMNLAIPLHSDIDRIIGIAPESITFDYNGNIYITQDPWIDFYKPDIADRKKLSQEELDNFYNGIPIIYKFKNEFN